MQGIFVDEEIIRKIGYTVTYDLIFKTQLPKCYRRNTGGSDISLIIQNFFWDI